jgi:hypothetical protein
LYILFDNYNNKLNNKDIQLFKAQSRYTHLLNEQKDTNYKKIGQNLISLFRFIQLQNITIKKIIYKQNTIYLNLFHRDKTKLLNFLNTYDGKVLMQNLEFIKQDDLYKMVIEVAF